MKPGGSILLAGLILSGMAHESLAFVPTQASSSASSSTMLGLGRDPQTMRIAEIKAELKQLGVGFGDCFDKESLVGKLVWARANPPPPPRPPPRTQQPQQPRARRDNSHLWEKKVEFGAESSMGSDIDMDVFAQAGWTGEEKKEGMSPVDHDRSPGLNRNFDELSTDDFKQSYRG